MRASVWASRVLPQPVGPIRRMLDLASSTSLPLAAVGEALVVIVHSDGEHALGVVLTDHVVGQYLTDLGGGGYTIAALDPRALVLLADDIHAELDALVADEHGRPRDELAHLVLALPAERAVQRVL